MLINLTKGSIKLMENSEYELERKSIQIVPDNETNTERFFANKIVDKEYNLTVQITKIRYDNMFDELFLNLFDGEKETTAVLNRHHWAKTYSYRNFLKSFLSVTDSLDSGETNTNEYLINGDVIVISKYSFGSVFICKDPLYWEVYLKIIDFKIIKAN